MLELRACIPEALRPDALDVVKTVKDRVFGDTPVRLVPDVDSPLVLDNQFLMGYPLADAVLEQRFRSYQFHPFGPKTLYLDIETGSAADRWNTPLEKFFRLGQYAIGDGPVQTTTRVNEIIGLMNEAPGVVAHHGHAFDFSVLLKDEALKFARDDRLFDTKVHASLALPAPDTYVSREGRKMIHASKPENALWGWLSLDNLCFQLGVPGKEGDLKALAKKYGGFDQIPLDDPEYLAYAVQDVESLRSLTSALLRLYPPDAYAWREQLVVAIDAQMTRNGLCVDQDAARKRMNQLAARKEEILTDLEARYGFPRDGKSPWATASGKQAIKSALADAGVDLESLPKTEKGDISLGGKGIVEATKGTPAEELGRIIAEVKGQRSLSELALSCVQNDGKVHPDIQSLQRSGRKSVTSPGLTIWDDSEKYYFVASPGRKLVSFDFSNADSRVVAALSQDKEYAKRFEPGADGHEISGRIVFGDDVYDSDPHKYRTLSKPLGHGWNYGGQPAKLAQVAKVPLEVATQFVTQMNRTYRDLVAWQNKVRKEGESGFIWNHWGRRMIVDRGHSFTQSPALLGQSGTREILSEAVLRMLDRDPRLIQWLVAQIHDELLADIPEEELDWAVDAYRESMEIGWRGIEFTVGHSPAVDNWKDATHG